MSYLGQAWNQGMFGWTLGNTLLAPNSPYPNCRMCSWDGDWDCPGMYGLSSYHPGGGNVAFADGSVRFLKTSTATFVVWALGSRAQRGSRLERFLLNRSRFCHDDQRGRRACCLRPLSCLSWAPSLVIGSAALARVCCPWREELLVFALCAPLAILALSLVAVFVLMGWVLSNRRADHWQEVAQGALLPGPWAT